MLDQAMAVIIILLIILIHTCTNTMTLISKLAKNQAEFFKKQIQVNKDQIDVWAKTNSRLKWCDNELMRQASMESMKEIQKVRGY